MTKIEAETLLNKYLKKHDKRYNNIVEIKCTEFKDYFCFSCAYKNEYRVGIYGVFKHNKAVILAPT